MSNVDCDKCAPEAHSHCHGLPYNGAAPTGGRTTHFRCADHVIRLRPCGTEADRLNPPGHAHGGTRG